jgi:error-prone DNA polymerase
LLNNQPMGFYSPSVIVNDARRHGVEVLPVDIDASRVRCTVEDGRVRLGFRYVRGLGEAALARLDAAQQAGPFRSLRDLCQRSGLAREAIENLIAIGACVRFGLRRRELLWQLGLVHQQVAHHPPSGKAAVPRPVQQPLPLPVEQDMVALRPLTAREAAAADYAIMELSPRYHWMQFVRPHLGEGVLSSRHLEHLPDGMRLRLAGLVVCRQRPGTAKGFLFVTIEDEFGLINLIVRPAVYERYRLIWRTAPVIIVGGTLQRREGLVNLLADTVTRMQVGSTTMPAAKSFR